MNTLAKLAVVFFDPAQMLVEIIILRQPRCGSAMTRHVVSKKKQKSQTSVTDSTFFFLLKKSNKLNL